MKKYSLKKGIALLLCAALLMGLPIPAHAEDMENILFSEVDNTAVSATPGQEIPEISTVSEEISPSESVRVSVVLERAPTMQVFSDENPADGGPAASYRQELREMQDDLTAGIEEELGHPLDVVWNLTLAANAISANVPYGEIELIQEVPGVAQVIVETRHDPMFTDAEEEPPADPLMAISTHMMGSNIAWQSGYTGSGMRIAIIDTGLDTDHQSMDPDALAYALRENAERRGMDYEAYLSEIAVETREEIAEKLPQLNMNERSPEYSADDLYLNLKTPFAFNYIDKDLDVTHDVDHDSDHGSHVAGISAANRYLKKDGGYVNAANAVGVVGNAPDAQLFVMKVFGKRGGAYDSDYMAAIEDAIVLGCDAVNLSLGSTAPGMSTNPWYQEILDSLASSNTVVSISAGNASRWSMYCSHGKLYVDGGISFDTVSSPGSYTNAFTVASVANDADMGKGFEVAGNVVAYSESLYSNVMFSSLDLTADQSGTSYPYVMLDSYGKAADFDNLDVSGKIVLCSRGALPFHEKANNAVERGAIAVIVYNNEPGSFSMNLDGYKYTAPVVSISEEGADRIRHASADENGVHTGMLDINHKSEGTLNEDKFFRMSRFSSWGVPSSLELKPEISAPGGNIYSLSGSSRATDEYQYMSGTSMAAPQIAGVAALVKEAIETRRLSQPGLTDRALAQSLMMSTAVPMKGSDGRYFPILQQGAGIANTAAAVSADSYLLVKGQPDGKVKAEVGDDADRTGRYSFTFEIHNLSDRERSYQLSADLFTQDTDGEFLDIKTVPMAADLSWSADGNAQDPVEGLEHYDFNGDGLVNRRDADALLDYVNGASDQINALDWADISGDGKVDTYDVHCFLNCIDGEALTVPAGATVTVTADLSLTAAQKAYLDATYPTGAYVEGYLNLQALSDEEGYVGTSHHVPVLGYYGSWTDAAMFDNGSYQTHKGGTESRDPYMGNTFINSFAIVYKDIPYTSMFFGGNPVLNDKGYYPERNAINTTRGDRISYVTTSPIRNAGAFRVSMINETTGEVLHQASAVKQLRGAYYHGGLGGWNASTRKTSIEWTPEGLQENEQLTCRYTLAPEYYVGPGKQVRWDDLGPGASISITATVDNTDPVLENVRMDRDAQKLLVSVRDNRYVAGVVLYNMAGDTVLGSAVTGADAEPGASTTCEIDISKVNGSKFLLQVVDYARNVLTYELDLPIGDGRVQMPMFVAYHTQQKCWTKFDTDTSLGYQLEKYTDAPYSFRAAAMAGSRIVGSTDTGSIYAFSEDDFSAPEYLAEAGMILEDLAYNPADGLVYGVAEGQLVTVDAADGTVRVLGAIGVPTNTLACDRSGTFYCGELEAAKVWSFTAETAAQPQAVLTLSQPAGFTGIQSMEMDLDTGLLYWIGHYTYQNMAGEISDHAPLLQIDPVKKTGSELGDLWYELPALLIQSDYAVSAEPAAAPAQEEPTEPAEAETEAPSEAAEAETEAPTEETQPVSEPETTVSGEGMSLQSITAQAELPQAVDPETDCGDGTVSLTLTADHPTTNGRIRIRYDAALLRYISGSGLAQVNSIHPGDGFVDVAYAAKNSISGGSVLAELSFTVVSGSEADFEVTVLEENTETPNTTEHVTVAAPAHTFRDTVVAPGCETAGYTQHTCTHCGYTYQDSFVAELGHSWGEWQVQVPATNQKEGLEVRTCSRCGKSEMRPIPKTDHSYEATVFEPTCTEPGYTLHVCKECGDTYRDNEVPALGHDWGVWVVKTPATVTQEGEEIRTCSRCGETESRIIPKTEHEDHVYDETVVDPTCTEPGYTLHTCTVCGYSYRDNEVPALGHEWGEWTVETPATCQKTGTEIRTCGRCGEVQRRTTPKTPHSYEAVVTEPTCTEEGFTTYTCTACGKSYVDNRVPALGHSWGEWTVETPATCQHTGTDVRTCSRCGEIQHRTSPKTPHNYEAVVTEPTCTAEGFTTYTCTVCGKSHVDNRVPALGHDWLEWEVETPATCQRQGTELRHCSRCDETETRIIPKTGHSYEAQDVEPTCTEEGYTLYTCTVCGHKYRDNTVPATGHHWGEWVTEREATCAKEGLETHTCTDCGVTEFRSIPRTEHNYVETVTEPTCGENGYVMKTCTICGHSCIDHEIPAIEHDWSEWKTIRTASCSREGMESRTCSRCGATESRLLEKLEHHYEIISRTAPTDTTPGYVIAVCTECGQRRITRIPPKKAAHSSVEDMQPVFFLTECICTD